MSDTASSKAAGPEHLEVKEDLFEEGTGGGVGVLTVLSLVLSLGLLFGGIFIQSHAFTSHDMAVELFLGGLALEVIAFVIPFGILPKLGK